MSEIYTGVKVKFKKLGELKITEDITNSANLITELLASLPEEFSPETSGNVSVRTQEGILISSTGSYLRNLSFPRDFSEVVSSSQEKRIRFFGAKTPSSETRMHLLAFEKRPNMKFCLHVHLPNIEKLQILNKFPVTSQFLSYGTINLAKEVSNLLKSSDIVILRDHGIVMMGNDFNAVTEEISKISKL